MTVQKMYSPFDSHIFSNGCVQFLLRYFPAQRILLKFNQSLSQGDIQKDCFQSQIFL